MPAWLHRAVDALAIAVEDRVRRAPAPLHLGEASALDCFGPLPPLPAPPERAGPWSAPAPRPSGPGDRLHVHVSAARGPRRGVALLVPPWKIRRRGLVAGYVALLTGSGYEAWLVAPPHHLERRAAGARSGEGFVSLDLVRTRAAFEQLVLELRLCAAVAAARGRVGVVGLSLGALGAALAATAPEALDFAALVAPPRLPLTLGHTGIGRRYRALAEAAGSRWPAAQALEDALAPLDPARRASTARRLLLAGGLHDAIAPASGVTALARAWGVSPRLYPRGHLTLLFACRGLRRDLASFLAG